MTAKSEAEIPRMTPDSVLIELARLKVDAFDRLASETRGEEAYRQTRERCERIAHDTELPVERVRAHLSILEQLYNVLHPSAPREDNWAAPTVDDVINSFDHLALVADPLKELIISRVQDLTLPNDAVARAKKLERLRKGLLNNAVHFKSFVDLRPELTADRESINGFVAVVQIQIGTDAERRDERNFVFQLRPEQLEDLQKLIDDVRKKLEAVGKMHGIGQLVIEDRAKSK